MVHFSGVSLFLKKQGATRRYRRRLQSFFTAVGHGKLQARTGAWDEPHHAAIGDLRISSAFLFWYTRDSRRRSRSLTTKFLTFTGDEPCLGELYRLLDLFGDYQASILQRHGPAQTEDLRFFRAPLRGGFLICQDHEGTVPLVVFNRQLSPPVGTLVLSTFMTKLFLRG